MRSFGGVISSLITPLKNHGQTPDLDAMRRLCDFLIAAGVDALMILGTTGEGPLLSIEERKQVASAVLEHVAARVPVIVHTGAITAAETMELNQHSRDARADAVAVVLPYFFGMDDQSLLAYFQEVCRGMKGVPIFLYSNPGATGNQLSPQVLGELADTMPDLAGIKISTQDVVQVQEYLAAAKERLVVINGSDELILPALSVGAGGFVSGISTAFPELYVRLFKAYKNCDRKEARRLQALSLRLIKALGDATQIAALKKSLGFKGIEAGEPRKPIRLLDQEEEQRLKSDLQGLGMLE